MDADRKPRRLQRAWRHRKFASSRDYGMFDRARPRPQFYPDVEARADAAPAGRRRIIWPLAAPASASLASERKLQLSGTAGPGRFRGLLMAIQFKKRLGGRPPLRRGELFRKTTRDYIAWAITDFKNAPTGSKPSHDRHFLRAPVVLGGRAPASLLVVGPATGRPAATLGSRETPPPAQSRPADRRPPKKDGPPPSRL